MTKDWWEGFFYGIALDFWRAVISDEQTAAEARFINTHLQLPVGARILDVPCGNGRLALKLANQGFHLTGVDLAAEFIEEARTKSVDGGLPVDWHRRDMRDLPWSNEFDGAFCFGNSFGYLDDQGNADSLKALSRTLKPGARYILDAPAIAECLLPNLQPHRKIEIAGITVEMDTSYDPEQRRMFNEFSFTRDGETDKRSSSQRIYTYRELGALLREAGLEPVADYSSLTGEAFEPGALRLFTVCLKR
jgi:SAM-dependent methyltransferase